MKFFNWLQNIDRRIMYLLLAVVIAVPLIWRMDLPIVVSPSVRGAYSTIDNMKSDKLAVISVIWASGTISENGPQTKALIRHLFLRNKKFAIVAFDPQGSKFAYDYAKEIGAEMGKTYGTDWVHWGFRPAANMVMFMQGFARDVPRTVQTDINGTHVTDLAAMKGVKDIHDIGLIADITPSATLDLWIAYIHGPYGTPIIYAPTAVMAPEGFNPLDAGQIKGMLVGMKGAAEYEHLLGRADFATRGAGALSSSHLLIIALIVLGNAGYVASRRRRSD